MDYLDNLKKLVGAELNCTATHLESVPIFEEESPNRYWKGTVEVFSLQGCATASRCYAWHRAEGKNIRDERLVIIRERPPVDSPRKAVQILLEADVKAELERAAKDVFGTDVTIGPIEKTTMGDLQNEHVQRLRRLFGIQEHEGNVEGEAKE